ncbi:hypothetical protein Bbelb_150600 [Branchiostoma belcheri]|nr:hypothetical protein Bbelb_150600 [Branchiostoma belcheri]
MARVPVKLRGNRGLVGGPKRSRRRRDSAELTAKRLLVRKWRRRSSPTDENRVLIIKRLVSVRPTVPQIDSPANAPGDTLPPCHKLGHTNTDALRFRIHCRRIPQTRTYKHRRSEIPDSLSPYHKLVRAKNSALRFRIHCRRTTNSDIQRTTTAISTVHPHRDVSWRKGFRYRLSLGHNPPYVHLRAVYVQKRTYTLRNPPQAGTATWHTGDPAATVRIPAPVVPGSVAVVSSQNHPFLPRVLLQESQSTTGTVHLPAAHTTQVQIHCQLDDDAAENDHLYEDVDGHLHLYASAAPPPVPDADDGPEHSEDVNGVHEHNDTSARPFPSPLFNPRQQATSASINTNSPQTMSVQPADNMENIVIDGGIATANELYEQHAHFNHESDSGQYQLITTPYCGAEDASQTETTHSVSRSSLSSLYGEQPGHMTLARDITRTDDYTAE